MTDQDRRTLEEMERTGSDFCQALAKAAFLADDLHFEKLKQCLPDYFMQYKVLANLNGANAAADLDKQKEWYRQQWMIALQPWIVDQEWLRLDALERSLREEVFRDIAQIELRDKAGLEESEGRMWWEVWRNSALTKLRKANSDKIKREGEVRLWKANG